MRIELYAPVFAAFAALAAVPLLIHLFGRPRAERRKFAPLGFLRRSDRRTARRRKIVEILLLVARCLAIAAVPLVLAKPFFETDHPGDMAAVISGRSESAVIVVDDSRSMRWRAGGKSLFDAAIGKARAIVDGMGRDSEAAILLTSSGSQAPQGELTPDRTRLRAALAAIQPSERVGDSTAALRRAGAILAGAPRPERRVYLVSDLAAHGLAADPPWGGSAEAPELTLVDAAGGRALANRAVVGLAIESAPQLGPRGLRIDAEVANFSGEAVKELEVTLRVDGRAVAKGLLDLPAQGRGTKRFFHALADPAPAAGEERPDAAEPPHDLAVEIAPDALADDDRRFARVQIVRRLRALLVDGDPRTIRRDDELFFLETALRPGDRDDSRIDLTVTTLAELPRHPLDQVDLVFLCNAKAPDGERAAALEKFVAAGGGLFLSMGDNVDSDAWNAALGDLLPQPLAGVRTVGAVANARDDGEARAGGDGERLARFDRRHPVLAPFTGAAGETARGPAEALREARVQRFALLKPTAEARDGHAILLRLESGAPLLVEGKHGAGRVMLLTTTADRDWSDLALQPAYLPLVQQSARYLARAALRAPDAPIRVGQPHEIALADGDQRLEVTLPSGAKRSEGASAIAARRLYVFTGTDEPGIYRFAAGSSAFALPRRPVADFAVNVDDRESDLARVEPARLAGIARPHGGAAGKPSKRRVELWHALGAALLGLMVAEGLLSWRRS